MADQFARNFEDKTTTAQSSPLYESQKKKNKKKNDRFNAAFGVCQGCLLSPLLINFLLKGIMADPWENHL